MEQNKLIDYDKLIFILKSAIASELYTKTHGFTVLEKIKKMQNKSVAVFYIGTFEWGESLQKAP